MPESRGKGAKERRGAGRGNGAAGAQCDGPRDPVSPGVVMLDGKGLIVEVNAEALRLMRRVPEGLQGRDFWDAVPEDVAEHHQGATREALALSDQHVFTAHRAFEDSWLEYCFTRQPSGLVVRLRDVTQVQLLQRRLEQSERRNQLIFDTNPNAMWIFDAGSSRILAVNEAAVMFYGIARAAFLKLTMGALFPDGQGASLLSALESLKGVSDIQLTPQICKQRKSDGQLVLVELGYGRLVWNDRKAVLVSLVDVTDRHLADRALRRHNADLEQRLEALQGELNNTRQDLAAFTYALSHDLQAPLHAANGFATMLADKHGPALEGTARHYVNRIQASTRQLARLVDDLRTLVQLPPLSGDLEKLDLADLAAPLIDDLRKRYPDRVVTTELEPGQELQGDRQLLALALACLLDNAWKFTARKPEAWVRLGLLPGKQTGEVIVQVSDNGNGFDPAYVGKLFTAFQRLHSSADFPGNGLGLALVKKVAERHGGRVWAESGETGASFFMALPQQAVKPPADVLPRWPSSIRLAGGLD